MASTLILSKSASDTELVLSSNPHIVVPDGQSVVGNTPIDDGLEVYLVLAQHQTAEQWNGRAFVAVLLTWAVRFNVEFKLDIPELALCLERLPCNQYGRFRYGHNGFGLKGEIAMNTRYLIGHRAFWEILGTLLHEMLHAWQQAHGTPGKRNHHNAEFRQKAATVGLLIDERGVTGYAARSPFKELLAAHEVTTPVEEILPRAPLEPGKSKLNKWSCGCTNIRVAVSDLQAQCLKCGQLFRQENIARSGHPESNQEIAAGVIVPGAASTE